MFENIENYNQFQKLRFKSFIKVVNWKNVILMIIIFTMFFFLITWDVSPSNEQPYNPKLKLDNSRHDITIIGDGIIIIRVDSHEYIHYRDGNNAASVGGIVHKEDCKFCFRK